MRLFAPLPVENALRRIDASVHKTAHKHKGAPLQVSLRSEKLGLVYDDPLGQNAVPFHIASIGKVFTAVLVFKLVEQGDIALDDPIAQILPATQLAGLFTVNGIDYSEKVTVRHLLGHMSGAADYFEGAVSSGAPLLQDILHNRDTFWTPDMLLEFTRTRQKPVGIPGVRYNYSDTGYILLGKMIEAITLQPFHTNLHQRIFDPLGMADSYLMFYSEPAAQPKKPIQQIWVEGTEVSRFKSLSCDWAGGGIVSTTADLLVFSRALARGELVKSTSYAAMCTFDQKFRKGIRYGLGLMELRFEEFFFLLRGLPRVTGHIGVLATHMFYDAATDTHIVMNFADTRRMTESFRLLIDLLGTIKRVAE
jgi:D-alanyl-D-alanine carboxypeptidase